MYCLKCGRKLKSGESKCVECGATVSGIEYCGGFWGLVGEEEKKVTVSEIETPKAVVKVQPERIEKPEKIDSKNRNSQRKRVKILAAIFLIVSFICLVQSLRVNLLTAKNDDLKEKYESILKEYEEMERKLEERYDLEEYEGSSLDHIEIDEIQNYVE